MVPFDLSGKRARIEKLEIKAQEEGFWDDVDRAQGIFKEIKELKSVVELSDQLEIGLQEAELMLVMVEEEGSPEFLAEIAKSLEPIEKQMEKFRLETLLSGEYDANDCVFSIHAGAGGLEAQDWAEMLLRMYTRWMSDHDFSFRTIDYNADTEGGIKSVTLVVTGHNAYGYLKSEKGVHRLVRISPFDTSSRRHTSFASIDVFPQLDEDEEVTIDATDLKIDTYRASGAGGQHVNTTDSAVRITHIPTGVIVQCQSERSQISNRETAMRMLFAKLLQIKEEENREKIEDIQGKYSQIGWGQQIRSYVFHPYSMVKDHRTEVETGNVQRVMDGDLDEFMNAYLNQRAIK